MPLSPSPANWTGRFTCKGTGSLAGQYFYGMKLFLVGFMGSGKTFLGQVLAERLGFGFLDLDARIEEAEGMSVAAIFEQHGEAGFREREAQCLRSLEAQQKTVVATGGGAPCFFENMDWMNQHGVTIYLHAQPAVLAARLLLEREKRPLVSSVDPAGLQAFIEKKLIERSPFYEKACLQFDVPETGLEGMDALVKYLQRVLP